MNAMKHTPTRTPSAVVIAAGDMADPRPPATVDAAMDVERNPNSAVNDDDNLTQDTQDAIEYDNYSRRSSLGADSVLDQDFSEDGFLDVDGAPSNTPLEVVLGMQYADDIFAIRKTMEYRYHASNCMADQPQVTANMRCTLVHWLIKVNHQLKFGAETVFVAVNLTDRFLAVTPLAQDCLQLLALATLFVAAKMEESVVPGISELVAICGGMYRHHHFRRMEVLVLSKLKFALYAPTSWYFLDHLALKATQIGTIDRRAMTVSRYVAETCLSSYEVSQYLPSVQAAAALSVALCVLPNVSFCQTLHALMCEAYTTEERRDATVCSTVMSRYMAPFLEGLSPDDTNQHFNTNTGPITTVGAASDKRQPSATHQPETQQQ
ncbi:cyclin-O protein B [Procambarus clarkii]|uniref:cyclin-O protein B n=1 Tax=Procambarus clarkii TaxID=6728 RepID=UPI0037443A30